MKLIVGLGNPGCKYRNSRHNVGYMVVMSVAKKNRISIKKRLYNGSVGKGRICDKDSMLLLPQTFMNLSGESVMQAAGRISGLEDLLIVYDDIDLLLGNIRFRRDGSSGGHKGMKSIVDKLKTENFSRLRIGIKPDSEVCDVSDFVLKPFLSREKAILKKVIEESVNGIEAWVSLGIEECMMGYNRRNVL